MESRGVLDVGGVAPPSGSASGRTDGGVAVPCVGDKGGGVECSVVTIVGS